ncbi:hypothetical protein [Sphingomonas japonica]|uniref:Apea-like HEPN domain-containing protein n=1 Tax=Sphingomonas japonica TaxID=511662 RepID=A0ABX0U247_9SPHN|nr:hypothetical protein [Sphingomonas japonica]NIJ24635.1 hypothetical protein [Sphingomonas japonica]
MRGELLNVWDKVWPDVFVKLSKHKDAPDELFSELYEAIIRAPVLPIEPAEPTQYDENGLLIDPDEIAAEAAYKVALEAFNAARSHYEQAISGNAKARRWLRIELPQHVTSESKALFALAEVHAKLRDISDDALVNRYFQLVEGFIDKYSLRYDLRRPFSLHPTLPGIFARMVRNLKLAAQTDAHLASSFHEFEDALRDLTAEQTPNRIKTCISKQTNFLEAIGQLAPNVTGNTLGAICNQVGTWPHEKLKESVKGIYGFASDYPGIRHGGTPANQLREIEMRDLVAVCVVMFGFSPYLTDQLNSDDIYAIGEVA